MKTKKILEFVICSIVSLQGLSQTTSLTKRELNQLLYPVITDFVRNHETKMENRKSEFIMIFIEMDSTSRVKDIRLVADEKNRDSVYAILSRMTPNDFKEWQPKNCKNKLIIIPLFAGGTAADNNYVDIFWQDYVLNRARGSYPAQEDKRIIVTNVLSYSPPIPIVNYGSGIKINKTSKKSDVKIKQ